MALSDENRVHPDLDAWVIPNFAQDVLGFNPTETLARLSQYPQRNMGDAITPFDVQWVDGTNEALHYRGNDLKRGKIWLQRGSPEEDVVRKYGYTGWQHRVGMATADVARCDAVLPVADKYDAWASQQGHAAANHYIVTRYVGGQHGIGFHTDKPKDIAPGTLITIVKLGECGRPFRIRWLGEKKPFFDRVLAPGTAVVMTLEANLQTEHAVPVVAECLTTGSIVFRTIKTVVPVAKMLRSIAKAKYGEKKRKRDDGVAHLK